MADAEHAETAPHERHLLVSRLLCSLAGRTEILRLVAGGLAARVYGAATVQEKFSCNYGLNPAYREQVFCGSLQAVGFTPDGTVCLIELAAHRFFVASLFMPQLTSTAAQPHPLILAFLEQAAQPAA